MMRKNIYIYIYFKRDGNIGWVFEYFMNIRISIYIRFICRKLFICIGIFSIIVVILSFIIIICIIQ